MQADDSRYQVRRLYVVKTCFKPNSNVKGDEQDNTSDDNVADTAEVDSPADPPGRRG